MSDDEIDARLDAFEEVAEWARAQEVAWRKEGDVMKAETYKFVAVYWRDRAEDGF